MEVPSMKNERKAKVKQQLKERERRVRRGVVASYLHELSARHRVEPQPLVARTSR
jgi:hypothetical protein